MEIMRTLMWLMRGRGWQLAAVVAWIVLVYTVVPLHWGDAPRASFAVVAHEHPCTAQRSEP